MIQIANLQELTRRFAARGVNRLLVKRLSPNDNSKNQIYVAGSFEVLNEIPFSDPVVRPRAGGREIVHAKVAFRWLTDAATDSLAPHAKLVLYPQYPEVRFSGFLQGSTEAPSEVLNAEARRDGRLLFLGIKPDRTVLGFACGPEHTIARELEERRVFSAGKLLAALDLGPESGRDTLLRRLGEIAAESWIASTRLDAGGVYHPCLARNCGGLTLEARLGIASNSRSEPDFQGWEVKQFGVRDFVRNAALSPLTLFTPEPTIGVYATQGVEHFVRRFGYADTRGRPNRMNFGGRFVVGRRAARTGLTLGLVGYDRIEGRITTIEGGLELRANDGTLAAGWPFPSLISHWNRKHAQAAFVPSQKREVPRAYRFGSKIFLGTGTDFGLFLAAVAAGTVYYDPGIKVEHTCGPSPVVHRRSQFRIGAPRMAHLYRSFEAVDLSR